MVKKVQLENHGYPVIQCTCTYNLASLGKQALLNFHSSVSIQPKAKSIIHIHVYINKYGNHLSHDYYLLVIVFSPG